LADVALQTGGEIPKLAIRLIDKRRQAIIDGEGSGEAIPYAIRKALEEARKEAGPGPRKAEFAA
jgi:hypothetical protein